MVKDTKTAPAAETENVADLTDAKPYENRDGVCAVNDGVIKVWDFPTITKNFLNYQFPDGAVNETYSEAMKKKIKWYHAQYIINALNEVIGINCWREYGEMESGVPQGKSATVSIYKGIFEIGNWKNKEVQKIKETYDPNTGLLSSKETITENVAYFEVLAKFETYGGSRNIDKWESLKGAKTNFLKKVCSFISNGWKSYALDLDEDFANQSVKDDYAKTAPAPKTAAAATTPKAAVNDGEPAAANAPTNGQAFAASPAKLSDKQDKMIFALFCKLESDETKRAERMAKALEAYKVKDKKDLTMTQAKHLIDKLLKMTGGDEAPAAQ